MEYINLTARLMVADMVEALREEGMAVYPENAATAERIDGIEPDALMDAALDVYPVPTLLRQCDDWEVAEYAAYHLPSEVLRSLDLSEVAEFAVDECDPEDLMLLLCEDAVREYVEQHSLLPAPTLAEVPDAELLAELGSRMGERAGFHEAHTERMELRQRVESMAVQLTGLRVELAEARQASQQHARKA